MKKLSIIFFVLFLAGLSACNKNQYIYYDGPDFFYFDTAQSSPTSILDEASITGGNAAEYYIHFSTRSRENPVTVSYTISTTQGLTEGVDYRLIGESAEKKLVFYPGSNYDRPIRMEFLPHKLDQEEKITITLSECSESGIMLGKPGPSAIGRSLTIIKTNH